MATALNVLLNVFVLLALVAFIAALFFVIFMTEVSPMEKAMRAIAFFGGALVVLAANASNIGYAQFTVNSLTGVRPAGGGLKILLTVIPGGVGVGLGWYFTRVWSKGNQVVGYRLLAFIGMLAITSYAVIYAKAFQIKGVELGVAILPNAAFIVGLIVYLMFRFEPDGTSQPGNPMKAHRLRTLRDAIRDRGNADHGSAE